MENNNSMIQVFENSEFGKVRTMIIDGEPWFVGKDVATILGYERNTKAAVDHVDEDDRRMVDGKTQSQFGIELGQRGGWVVNESGVYALIFSSKLDSATRFKKWVTREVLPSIRKHGAYLTPKTTEELLTNPDLLIELATALKAERAKSAELLAQNADLKNEVEHKENVIIGLVEDIDLAEKRQRIVQIIRRGRATAGAIKARWALLYTEFEKKYRINLNARLERVKSKTIKNRMDVIDKNMNMIPQLFEICCKLYENDYNALMKTWESTIKCVDEPDEDEEV